MFGDIWTHFRDAWTRLKDYWEANAQREAENREAQQRERQLGIETTLAPNVTLDRIVERMTREGWAIQHRTDTTATFARDTPANAAIGCCLMFLFILPGLLYVLLGTDTARVTVASYPHEGRSRVVIGGDSGHAIGELAAFVREMSGESTPPPPLEEHTPPPGQPIAQKLGELAEARDAGLITQEEFEAKKRDLLDRL